MDPLKLSPRACQAGHAMLWLAGVLALLAVIVVVGGGLLWLATRSSPHPRPAGGDRTDQGATYALAGSGTATPDAGYSGPAQPPDPPAPAPEPEPMPAPEPAPEIDLNPQVGDNPVIRPNPSPEPAYEPIPQPVVEQRQPFDNSLGMSFVRVPGADFLICVNETRVRDFKAFVSATGHESEGPTMVLEGSTWNTTSAYDWSSPNYNQSSDYPVTSVSWHDAVAFCQWLTKQERKLGLLRTTEVYRLPTDEEWSIAAGLGREPGTSPMEKEEAGSRRPRYAWGSTWPPPDGAANIMDTHGSPLPVGSFKSSRDSLPDMCGNVWEWCQDDYMPDLGLRVLRGGAWHMQDKAEKEYALAYRHSDEPIRKTTYIGFRVVLESP